MKKIFLYLVAVLLIGPVCAEEADSLLIGRSSLYYQYLDIKNNTEEFSTADYKNLSELLEQVVLYDNRVLDSLDARTKENEKLRKSLGESEAMLADLNMEKKDRSMLHLFLMVGTGLFLAVFILVVILLILRSAALKRLKKEVQSAMNSDNSEVTKLKENVGMYESKLMDKDALIKRMIREKEALAADIEARNMELQKIKQETTTRISELEVALAQAGSELSQLPEIQKLRTALAEKESLLNAGQASNLEAIEAFNKQIAAWKTEIHDLKDRIDNFEETVREKDHAIEHIQAEKALVQHKLEEKESKIRELTQRSVHDKAYFGKLSEIDLNMVKLEKLERLKEKQILTEEEYRALKQKFLDQF